MPKGRSVRCLLLALLFCLPLLSGLPVRADAATDAPPRLLKVVALASSGVYAPVQSGELLDSWTERVWPQWPARYGELTRRGADLVTELWSELRNRYLALGLLPTHASPAAVYVRADNLQRTRATASALLRGLLPQGNNGYAVAAQKPDPLFHPVANGMCVFNLGATAKDVLRNMEDGLPGLNAEYAEQLALVDKLVGQADPALCLRYSLPPNCRLSSIPSSVAITRQGTRALVQGGLGIAASLTRIFLKEFSQWPSDPAAWGQADTATMRQILSLQTAVFNVVQRTRSVASAQGSTLLNVLVDALEGHLTDSRGNRSPVIILVGDDINIANVAGLLDIHWQASGYPADCIPPAGVLAFELWQEGSRQVIRIKFFAHALETLHSSTPFEDEESLASFAVRLGRHGSSVVPLAAFYDRARAAIRQNCIFPDRSLPQLVAVDSEGPLENGGAATPAPDADPGDDEMPPARD